MLEKNIQSKILLNFGGREYMRLWRINVGLAYSYNLISAIIRMLSAKDFSNAAKMAANLRPIYFGIKGHADIAGIMNDGRCIYIEVKSASGRQTEEQKLFQKMVDKFNGIYILARSEEDVEKRLKQEGYIK